MADKRISQLVDRGTVANNDVVPIVVSGAVTTNKATISSIQTFMQGNLDLGVTSVGFTLTQTDGQHISVTGSPITTSGNITLNLPRATDSIRGLLDSEDFINFSNKQSTITLTTTGTSGAATLVSNTLNIPNYTQDLSGFVTLGTAQTITAQKSFTTSGSSDTMIISHGSGSGFALDVIKAGNGEAIRVTKTSGSGNAMTITGGNFSAQAATFSGVVTTTPDAVINGVNVGRGGGSISSNTRVGLLALNVNTTGSDNTAYGVSSGGSNTTGLNNSFFGHSSGFANTTGSNNSFFGITAGQENITGEQNSFFGASAGRRIANGDALTIANNSVLIGFDSRALANNQTNQIVIGHNAIGNGSNTVTLGNDSITSNIFNGNLSTRRAVGTASEGIIELRPNTGSSNIIIASGTVPLHILSTSGSLGLGVGNIPQVTIASGGAVTLTGALNGTSAVFSGNFAIGTGSITGAINVDSFRSNLILGAVNSNKISFNNGSTTETGYIFNSPSETAIGYPSGGSFNIQRLGVGNVLTLASTGAATFSSSVTAATAINIINNAASVGSLVFQESASNRAFVQYLSPTFGTASRQNSLELGTITAGSFIAFRPLDAEAMRITSEGNVGIGTAAPNTKLQVEDGFISTYHPVNLNSAGYGIQFFTNGGGSKNTIGEIGISQVGTARSGDLLFLTSNAAAPTERMRITSGGEVLVGTQTTDVNTVGCQLRPFGLGIFVRSGAAALQLNRTSSDGIIASFRTSDVERGSISISGSVTSYNVTSDYRLKEDFQEIKGLEKLQAIKVYDYKWKLDEKRMDGVLAHELAEVLPYAVFGEKDEVDEDGNDRMQSVDYSKIVPILIKAIQEQQEQIDSLKNQIK